MTSKTTKAGEFIRYKANADGIKAQLQRCGTISAASPLPGLTLDILKEELYRVKRGQRIGVKRGRMPEVEMRFYGDEEGFIDLKNSLLKIYKKAVNDQ